MSRRRSPLVDDAVAVLSASGHAADVDLDGAHIKVRWVANGRKHLLVIARTPSDRRACANSRSALRRLLRQEERP
jgi:hypothetical protein